VSNKLNEQKKETAATHPDAPVSGAPHAPALDVSRATPTEGLLHPLRIPVFRNLIAADVVSDIGTFMQSVGAAWLMVSLGASPLYIALTTTASSLPFFIFALPAGSIGDIVDRRKLVLATETWMASVAVLLMALTIAGKISPLMLLLLTFALSAGDAFESPTWRAILPELVPKEDLPSASALNGIEFNIARAVGPALAGAVIAAAGIGTAFTLNAVSFIGVIYVVARWKRVAAKRKGPAETLGSATAAALRYVRYSPAVRGLALRSGATMFFASALLALLPSIAHDVSKSPLGYGALLGCFGAGAIGGGLLLNRLRARRSAERVVSGGVMVFGVGAIAVSWLSSFPLLCAAMLVAGASWLLFISLFNVLLLNEAPDWVRARVLAIGLLVTQGALAAGSALWGEVATRYGIHTALFWAGAGAIATTALVIVYRLPDATADLTPWSHWKMPPELSGRMDPDAGPILVAVEYEVAPERETEFLKAIYKFERIRRRDGAYQWGIFQDLERPRRFVETFLTASWGEHLRQHERTTVADRALEEHVRNTVLSEPKVSHLAAPAEP
jgi:MFS family permease